jgi:hypothetical protein
MREIDRIRRGSFARASAWPGGGPYRGVKQAPDMPPSPQKVEAVMNEQSSLARDAAASHPQIPAEPSKATTAITLTRCRPSGRPALCDWY